MNPWAAIVGRGEEGRREVCRAVVDGLRRRGLRVGGALQEPAIRGGRERGFDLVDLDTGERVPLARVSGDPDLCDFAFEADGFEQGRAWSSGDQPVVVVEAGKHEASGRGHWPTIRDIVEGPPRVLILLLRRHALVDIALRLSEPVDGLELPAEDDARVEAFVERVAQAARDLEA
ncbi:MAG: DUF2478 domain-containing protein [Myxococcota bacterium]